MIRMLFKSLLIGNFFVLSGCGGFLNPFDDCFLDWNMNCIEREKQELSKEGYIYTYSGDQDEVKKYSTNAH